MLTFLRRIKSETRFFYFTSLIFLSSLGLSIPGQTQVVPDETVGTQVNSPDCLNCTITGGTQLEGNLFHSFHEFSIHLGGSAFFDNASNKTINSMLFHPKQLC